MFPLHYIENHDHFTFPCKKIYLLDLPPQEHAHPQLPHAMHCQLTYEENNTFLLPIENQSTEDDILAQHLPSIAEEENDMEEHFPTVSLDDDFWMEEPVPERHLCIHEDTQHDLCPYPCPYDLNQLHLA